MKAENTGFPSENFDVVSALALLEHLKNPLLAIQEAYKTLKPGGLFIASSPNQFWDHISTKLGLLKNEQHEVDMNKKIMIKLVIDAGFEVVGFKRFMWSPISFLPYLKIKVPPVLSLKIDSFISNLFINPA